ncbi:alpha/beta fold hydrolase [Thermodesulfobacteriota bacterium]
MVFLFKTAVWIVALLCLHRLLGIFWNRLFHVSGRYDQLHFAKTTDGWEIAMHRYTPEKQREETKPVILCHGLGANRFNFDLGEGRSLACYLRDRGYDTWVVDLRGAGHSSRPQWFNRFGYGWTMDDHIDFDLPAAIDLVKRRTGAREVNWVGHSMGGIVMYAYLAGGGEGISSVTAIASPGAFGADELKMPYGRIIGLFMWLPVFHFEFLARGFTPIIAGLAPWIDRMTINAENMDRDTIGRALANLVSDISMGVMRQFIRGMKAGCFMSADGSHRYQDHYRRITVPLFLGAGSMDGMVKAKAVRFVFDAVSSEDKRFKVFGREHGDLADYGHGDLLVGNMAEQDVFPQIEAWLAAH